MDNGRFKETDFLRFRVRGKPRLAILKSQPAQGLGFDEQSAKLPEGFRSVNLEEIRAFIDCFQAENGHYPEVGRVLVWTAKVDGVNREAVVIDSVCQMFTINPQSLGFITAYTGAPIVVAATKACESSIAGVCREPWQ